MEIALSSHATSQEKGPQEVQQ